LLSVATYSRTGIVTKPNEMVPLHTIRIAASFRSVNQWTVRQFPSIVAAARERMPARVAWRTPVFVTRVRLGSSYRVPAALSASPI
jgi:hypothetical protein